MSPFKDNLISVLKMPVSKPKILFFNPALHAVAQFEALSEVTKVELVSSKSRQELLRDSEIKYHNVQAIYRTSASGAVSLNIWSCTVYYLKC